MRAAGCSHSVLHVVQARAAGNKAKKMEKTIRREQKKARQDPEVLDDLVTDFQKNNKDLTDQLTEMTDLLVSTVLDSPAQRGQRSDDAKTPPSQEVLHREDKKRDAAGCSFEELVGDPYDEMLRELGGMPSLEGQPHPAAIAIFVAGLVNSQGLDPRSPGL